MCVYVYVRRWPKLHLQSILGLEYKPDNSVGPLRSGGAVLVILNDNVILPFTGSDQASSYGFLCDCRILNRFDTMRRSKWVFIIISRRVKRIKRPLPQLTRLFGQVPFIKAILWLWSDLIWAAQPSAMSVIFFLLLLKCISMHIFSKENCSAIITLGA